MTAVEPTDEDVVRLVLAGDHERFAVLVERHKRGVSRFVGSSVKGASDVADLSQETFLRAYSHLGTFKAALGRFATWLYHIARNVVRTFLGKSLRRPHLAALADERAFENALPDLSADADPTSGVLRSEAERDVRAALAELPERTRAILSLRYYDGLEYQAIARTMDLSLGNVKTLIHRGKLALAQKLRERDARAEAALRPGTAGAVRALHGV